MKIDIAICTWNRAELLDETLTQLRTLNPLDGVEWNVIVINNACTDHTDEVINKHLESLPLVSHLEKEQGLSQARNRALRESDADYLIFLDDDVLVTPDWLIAYSNAAKDWPEAGFYAGAVDPWYEKPIQPHIEAVLNELTGGAYLGLNLGDKERWMAPPEGPRGANLMIRRGACEGLLFDPAFGRTKDAVWFGDEMDFCDRIRDKGYEGVWVPQAKLQHFVPESRVELPYLKTYFEGLGVSMVRQQDLSSKRTLASVPIWVLKNYLGCCLGKYFHIVKGDRVGHFRKLSQQWRYSGIIKEFREISQAG